MVKNQKIKLEDYKGEYLIVDGFDDCIAADIEAIEDWLEIEGLNKEEVDFYGAKKVKMETNLLENIRCHLCDNYDTDDDDFNYYCEEAFKKMEEAADILVNKMNSGIYEKDGNIIEI